MRVNVIGAGLAGSEAAWQLLKRGFEVDLYEMKPQKYSPAHHMPGFAELMDGLLLVFVAIALTMIGLVVYHYIYHRIDTKSYYVMRRLPNRWELHLRCLTLPLAGLLICGAAALIVIAIYYWIYMGCTPEECLMPGQWAGFWR